MFYERLKAACKNANTTVTATLKAIGIGTANGTYWKNGSIPSSDIIVKLAEFLDVSTDYLLLGVNPSDKISEEQQTILTVFESLSPVDKARVIERAETLAELAAERVAEQEKVQHNSKKEPLRFPAKTEQDEEGCCYIDICALPAGAGTGVYLEESRTEPLKIVHTDIADRANYAIRVSGDSMEPKFYDGDIVLVETCPSVEVGEIGIFIVNGEGFIKQYDGNTLISLNPKRKNIHLQKDDTVYCRGRVLGIAETAE